MRIALVADHPSPVAPQSSGTAEPDSKAQHVVQLAQTLSRLGHQVTIYAPQDTPVSSSKAGPGVTIEPVPVGPAGPAREQLAYLAGFSDQLARRWRRHTPDVVHAHFWTSGLAALAAARDLPVPVVQTFQTLGTSPGEAGDRARRMKLESLIGRAVTTVLAGSSAEVAELASLGVPRSVIKVVPYGVDTDIYRPDGPAARRGKRTRLLTVAPLTDQRQLDTMLWALTLVPQAELMVAGGPPQAELAAGPGYRRLTELATGLGVRDRLVCTGRLSPARMPALLRSADVLLHLASHEPLSMVPEEAMACGTPVIAADDGPHSDAVVDGATGVLIRPGQPTLLARTIRRLLASPMLLDGYGIAAADRARARYGWERVGQETVAAYAAATGQDLGREAGEVLEAQVA